VRHTVQLSSGGEYRGAVSFDLAVKIKKKRGKGQGAAVE
jgi:hypothetical protein